MGERLHFIYRKGSPCSIPLTPIRRRRQEGDDRWVEELIEQRTMTSRMRWRGYRASS